MPLINTGDITVDADSIQTVVYPFIPPICIPLIRCLPWLRQQCDVHGMCFVSEPTVIPQNDGLMDLWIAGLLGLNSK